MDGVELAADGEVAEARSLVLPRGVRGKSRFGVFNALPYGGPFCTDEGNDAASAAVEMEAAALLMPVCGADVDAAWDSVPEGDGEG